MLVDILGAPMPPLGACAYSYLTFSVCFLWCACRDVN